MRQEAEEVAQEVAAVLVAELALVHSRALLEHLARARARARGGRTRTSRLRASSREEEEEEAPTHLVALARERRVAKARIGKAAKRHSRTRLGLQDQAGGVVSRAGKSQTRQCVGGHATHVLTLSQYYDIASFLKGNATPNSARKGGKGKQQQQKSQQKQQQQQVGKGGKQKGKTGRMNDGFLPENKSRNKARTGPAARTRSRARGTGGGGAGGGAGAGASGGGKGGSRARVASRVTQAQKKRLAQQQQQQQQAQRKKGGKKGQQAATTPAAATRRKRKPVRGAGAVTGLALATVPRPAAFQLPDNNLKITFS